MKVVSCGPRMRESGSEGASTIRLRVQVWGRGSRRGSPVHWNGEEKRGDGYLPLENQEQSTKRRFLPPADRDNSAGEGMSPCECGNGRNIMHRRGPVRIAILLHAGPTKDHEAGRPPMGGVP